jgi:glycosyltransferase involved in cell wall biosynthesis
MKIAITTDAIWPYTIGGSELRNQEIGKRLVKKGHEVHIYGAKLWEGPDIIKQEGVIIHGVCYFNEGLYKHNGKRSSLDPLKLSIKLYHKISKEKFDIVNNLSFTFFNCFATKLYTIKTKTPLVLTWQQFFGDYLLGYFGKVNGNIARTLEFISTKLTKNHIAVSHFVKKELTKRNVNPKNIKVIYNGADVKSIKKIPNQKKIYDLVFVGRLNYQKNISLLIKSIKEVKKIYPTISLALIGGGEDKEKLINLTNELGLEKNIKFFGKINDRTKLYKLIKSSEIFTLPSVLEGFPLTIIEANACGLPAISTKTKHNNTTEHLNECGISTNPNSKDFSKAIIKLLKDKKLREKYAKISGKKSDEFDWDKITDQEEKYYLKILKKF